MLLSRNSMLKIVTEPNPILHKVCDPVSEINLIWEGVATEMLDLIQPEGKKQIGIGLAAPQVGINARLIVLAVPGWPPMVMFNPELELGNRWKIEEEGCLSLPGKRVRVERATKLRVKYQNACGEHHSMKANDLLARAIQHEYDHIQGILITDKEEK
jgi:peptide deformylase